MPNRFYGYITSYLQKKYSEINKNFTVYIIPLYPIWIRGIYVCFMLFRQYQTNSFVWLALTVILVQ